MDSMYINYKNYSVYYNPTTYQFRCSYHNWHDTREQVFLEGAAVMDDDTQIPSRPEPKYENRQTVSENFFHFQYWAGENTRYHFDIIFILRNNEMAIRFYGAIKLKGRLHWGENPAENTFAGLFDTSSPVLHTASGPVTHSGDDMLFDRENDRVLRFIPRGHLDLDFDWEKNAYSFVFFHQTEVPENGLRIQVKENYIAEKFNVPYKAIDKRNWFATPPVGWMTWYAVRFDAGEKEVLENTRLLHELLGKYSDNLVSWVDWEWYHSDHSGKCHDCDVFTPRADAYPHGMSYVAEKIRELGCIPAIWVGLSNDGRLNKWFQKHRECLLGPLPRWCGQWWVDPGYPEVNEEYVPMVMKQLIDWGYDAVKWDCLSLTPRIWSEMHEKMKEPNLDPGTATRQMVQAGRKVLGDDIFMLYCNPVSDNELSAAAGVFNSARIGGDVFGWYEFVERAIDRLFHFYPMHNTLFLADCDNIVLRAEYCNMVQARSRVSFYGLTGVPLTIGDRFREYDKERLDMLRRIVPVVDMHPVELQSKDVSGTCRILISSFRRPFGAWQVVGVMNTGEEHREIILDFAVDCRLPTGGGECYAVYDYWANTFLGIFDRAVNLSIKSCDTAVVRITPVNDDSLPTLISSSRHITQGGYELTSLQSNPLEGKIEGTVKCVGNEPEKLTFLLPAGAVINAHGGSWSQEGCCGTLTIETSENKEVSWSIEIQKDIK